MMAPVLEDTYLGDIVRADGKNFSNVQSRMSKGLGIISQIMTILQTVSFGEKYFHIALSLREAMFLNGILTNADVWYHFTKNDPKELEIVDRLLLQKILSVPDSTPNEALYLETGCIDIDTVIKGKRVNFLQYLIKEKEETMLSKVFKAQWDRPVRGDRTIQARADLDDLNIPGTLEYLKEISTVSFKDLVRKKCKDYALEKFLKLKTKHSKLDNLEYKEIRLQNYLELKDIDVEDSKILIGWRLRMTKLIANYGDSERKCPLCQAHYDSQEDFFKNCNAVKQQISNTFNYMEIFKNPRTRLLPGTNTKP